MEQARDPQGRRAGGARRRRERRVRAKARLRLRLVRDGVALASHRGGPGSPVPARVLPAARFGGRPGNRLVVTRVGDALQEPFWPEGLGVNRGMNNVLDAAWCAAEDEERRSLGDQGLLLQATNVFECRNIVLVPIHSVMAGHIRMGLRMQQQCGEEATHDARHLPRQAHHARHSPTRGRRARQRRHWECGRRGRRERWVGDAGAERVAPPRAAPPPRRRVA